MTTVQSETEQHNNNGQGWKSPPERVIEGLIGIFKQQAEMAKEQAQTISNTVQRSLEMNQQLLQIVQSLTGQTAGKGYTQSEREQTAEEARHPTDAGRRDS